MGLGGSKNSVSAQSVAISGDDYTHSSSLINVNGKTDYRGITTGNPPAGFAGMFENGLFSPITAAVLVVSMILVLGTISYRSRQRHARQNISFPRAGETRELVEIHTI